MKTHAAQEPDPAPFTGAELQDFLEDLFAAYISSGEYDGWAGHIREKHFRMLRYLQRKATEECCTPPDPTQ